MVTLMVEEPTQKTSNRMIWFFACLTLIVCGVFAKLGSWQLARAQEKIDLMEAAAKRAEAPALETVAAISEKTVFRQIELNGRFDFERQFLRDNQMHSGRVGYDVLTPFYSTQNPAQVVLVNRGWVPLTADRSITPDIMPASNLVIDAATRISGIVVQPSTGFTLGAAVGEGTSGWPLLLQYLDYEIIAEKLNKIDLVSAVIVLDAQQPLSYVYNWQPVADGPAKHYGYAFQWFAMLLAVLFLFIYHNYIKRR